MSKTNACRILDSLGIHYQLREYTVDPDDLSAHYNLAILYRRLGMKDKAAIEAAAFADQKDDPTASTYAFEFLQKHTEIANEGIVWHTHELDIPWKPGKQAPKIVAPTSSSMSGGEF